ncbi:Type II secretion system family protein [Desulfonema magnum]|uniref:Type II secretion system family protein n=1 Tax=Desulfonema magnum TaxID=45655 RepID=A0A975BIV0_9BACT|nr:Type II secretion system family protein [Desulfonema magnum]
MTDPQRVRKARPDDVALRLKLQKIGNKIYAAKNLNEILISLIDEFIALFKSERITIYVLDGETRELISRIMSGKEIKEIRISVSPRSIAGYAAHKQRIVNVRNVHDRKELAAIDPELRFDDTWDKKTGFVTKQVLAVPIFFQKYLMGAMQVMNRKDGKAYTATDEKIAAELARMIGIGLYNKRRAARQADSKFNYLLQKHLLTPTELKKAIADAGRKQEPVETFLLKTLKIPKKELGKSLAKYYNVPFAEYDENTPIPKNLLKGLKVPFLRKNVWIPLRSEGDKIVVAVDDPQNFQKINGIKTVFPKNPVEFCVALKEDVSEFIDLFTGKKKKQDIIEIDPDKLSDELLKGLDEEDEDAVAEHDSDLVSEDSSAVVKLVNKIIIDAREKNASDIHVEPYPGKQDVRVRIRIDGACQEYNMKIPYSYRAALVSRIKIMCNLDIAERRKPQDGKIQFKRYAPGRDNDIELRVATIPTQGGMEDVVMRLLAAGEPMPIQKMGFSERNLENFLDIITKPYGIIFVCGPTGSGKTTTLHSALKYINKVETKIWTAEDPVEITQAGLRQVQVQPKIGFNFAAAMRAFLRADPDVIMVGEMRDKETTSIGIEASLTGHLVFSTLHTNSAPESVVRLLDMGMDPFNFADAVLGILAQRLVRTLCKDCKERFHPSKDEFDKLIREYGEEMFEKDQLATYSDDFTLFRAKDGGCEKCNGTGYRGRMGIHELMIATDDQKKLIQTQARVKEMQDQAIYDGMRTLKQDGVAKIFKGFTDLEQVKRVCIQ